MTQAPESIMAFTALVNRLIEIDRSEGLDNAEIHRRLTIQALLMAADMHCESGGNDASFMHMARRSLALARTGAVEQ
jgi:hypothetical protein